MIRDVTTAYWNVLAARELVRITEEDVAQRERFLDETTKRQSAGTATDYDVLAARVAVENARPAVIKSQNLVRQVREQLRFLLAEPGEVDVDGTLGATVEPAPSYDELLARALANRPELGQIRVAGGHLPGAGHDRARGQQAAGRFLGGMGQEDTWPSRPCRRRAPTGAPRMFATVPLFDGWRTKGRVAQARSDLASLTIDELKLREGISVEVRTAIDAFNEATEILAALKGTVEQAERLLFLSEKGYELGVKTRLEVQDAEQNLRQARYNLAAAQRDYQVARVNLDWVAGTLDGGMPIPAPTP